MCLLCLEGHVPPSLGMLESCGIVGAAAPGVLNLWKGKSWRAPGAESEQLGQELELGGITDCLKCWAGRRGLTGGGFGGHCSHQQLGECAGGSWRGDRDGSPEIQHWECLPGLLSRLWELC